MNEYELVEMEAPCQCDCGRWFDLDDGYSSRNNDSVICSVCEEREEIEEEIETLEQEIEAQKSDLEYNEKELQNQKNRLKEYNESHS